MIKNSTSGLTLTPRKRNDLTDTRPNVSLRELILPGKSATRPFKPKLHMDETPVNQESSGANLRVQ